MNDPSCPHPLSLIFLHFHTVWKTHHGPLFHLLLLHTQLSFTPPPWESTTLPPFQRKLNFILKDIFLLIISSDLHILPLIPNCHHLRDSNALRLTPSIAPGMEQVHKVLLLMVTKMTRDRRRHPALGGSGATNLIIQTAFMHGGNLLHLNGSVFSI